MRLPPVGRTPLPLQVLLALALIACALIGLPASALSLVEPQAAADAKRRPASAAPAPDLSPYRGVSAWIDMYNRRPWEHPRLAVDQMHERGVDTLFLQTSNYDKKRALYRPRALAAFIDNAHGLGIEVVAWYVPSFANIRRDFRRTMAAIRFETASGQRFDSFAMDIEATKVSSIETRNRRLARLSQRVRGAVGDGYALGAIVPEAGAAYWPGYPYRLTARHYDVFLPMGYFSYRTTGYHDVYRYTSNNIRSIRRNSGDRRAKVHFIGGIAGDADDPEVRGFLDAARDRNATGAGMYDFPLMGPSDWEQLRRYRASL